LTAIKADLLRHLAEETFQDLSAESARFFNDPAIAELPLAAFLEAFIERVSVVVAE
jgi:hypothetical protein